MAGLGAVIGGALSGFGAGMVKQAEMDWTQRREMALESARAQRERENIQMEGDQARQTAKKQSELREQEAKAAEQRQTDREKNKVVIPKVKETFQDEKGLYYQMFDDGTIRPTKIKGPPPKPSSQVTQVVQDEKGEFKLVMSDGTMRDTKIVGSPKVSAKNGGGRHDVPLQKSGVTSVSNSNRPSLSSFGG